MLRSNLLAGNVFVNTAGQLSGDLNVSVVDLIILELMVVGPQMIGNYRKTCLPRIQFPD